ncbi:unnamed protein product [Staurois parvus]|uniref:Uncharacterized protein n=1 Tax=Staurois parvus TaxID=386267 RepID=A0ABN9EEU3_9NEOB|nr:unnamed protein product [Staurois parvus]
MYEVPSDDRCSTVSGGHSEHRITVLRAPREHAQAGCGEAAVCVPWERAAPRSGAHCVLCVKS